MHRRGLIPGFAMFDVPDRPSRNAKTCGKFAVGFDPRVQACPELDNVGGGELGQYAPSHVDRMGHGLQVVGVDARMNTAKMIQFKPVRNRPIYPLVIEPMCPDRLSATLHRSVSALCGCPLPHPTRRDVAPVFNEVRHRGSAAIVSVDKTAALPDLYSLLGIVGTGTGCATSATAKAAAGRIRSFVGILGVHCSDSSHESGGAVTGAVDAAPGRFVSPLYHPEDVNA